MLKEAFEAGQKYTEENNKYIEAIIRGETQCKKHDMYFENPPFDIWYDKNYSL